MSKVKALVALSISIAMTIAAVSPILILTSPPALTQHSSLQLTYGNWQNIDPAFSPDGSAIVYSSNKSGSYQIWTMSSIDGSHQRALTSLSGNSLQPSYNPKGTVISFLWYHGNFSDLCLTSSISHAEIHCVTSNWHVQKHYSWSPDGNMIAFSNGTSIFLYNIKTNQTSHFNMSLQVAIDPAFSSSGLKLLLSGSNGSGYAIWETNLDGSNLTRISWTGYDFLPQTSMESNAIMYLTNYSGVWEPWIVNADSDMPSKLFQFPPNSPTYFPPQPPELLAGSVPRFSPNGSLVLLIQDLGNGSSGLVIASLNYETYSSPGSGIVYITPYSVINGITSSCISDIKWNPVGSSFLYVSCSSGESEINLLQLSASNVKSAYG